MTATVSLVGVGLVFDVVSAPGGGPQVVEPVVQNLALSQAGAAAVDPSGPPSTEPATTPPAEPSAPVTASVTAPVPPSVEAPVEPSAPTSSAPTSSAPTSSAPTSSAPAASAPAPSTPPAFTPGASDVLTTDVVEADQEFSLVGITWDADGASPTEVQVEVRVREADGWTGWTLLEANDAGPDAGTEEAEMAADVVGTEPLLTSDADAVQVRVRSQDDELPEGLNAVVIDPGTSTADEVETSDAPLSEAGAEVSRPAIVTRSQWGADESLRRCNPSYSSTVVGATVHHTAGSNSYTASQSKAVVRGIYAYHTGSLGWCDIGYNFLVDKYGTVFEGRYGGVTRAVRGAHSGGFNDRTFGVAAIGNYETASTPSVMVAAIGRIVGWKLGVHGRTATGSVRLTSAGGGTSRYASGTVVTKPVVFAHRDVGQTACPGDNLYARMGTIRTTAALWAVGDLADNLVTPVRYGGAPRTDLLTYDRASGARYVFGQRSNALLDPKTRSAWTKGWSHVVEVELDGTSGTEVVVYNRGSGRVQVLDVRSDGSTPALYSTSWSRGWTDMLAVETDGTSRSELLVYNRSTGRQLVVDVDVKKKTTRSLSQVRWSSGWSHVTALDLGSGAGKALSVYNRSTGRHLVLGLSSGRFSRTLSSKRFSTGWDVVEATEIDRTGRSELLTYKRGTGRVVFSDLSSTGRTSTISMADWSRGWTSILMVSVDGSAGDEVLTYNASSGRMVTTDLSSSGRPRTIG